MIETTTLRELARRVEGPVLVPGVDAYDEARILFNTMIDRRPAAIVKCTSAPDVAAVVITARDAGVPLAVRGGGHSVAGASLNDGGLVADLRPLGATEVDPGRLLARVGGGATWATVDRATQEHGLATVGGRVSTTGVAGLTLGGGSGWLERRFGLACDALDSVELVTASGEVITASADEHSELFWALHGGGGNFGVATSLTFRLQPVGPQVLAGLLLHRGDEGANALRRLRDVMADAPDELGTAFAWITGPAEDDVPAHLHDEVIAVTMVCWSGDDHEAGERVIAPLRAQGVEADFIEPVPYADFNCSIDDPPGYRNWWTAEHLDAMPDEAIDAIAEQSLAIPKGPSQTFIVPWGGAVARQGGDWPLARRDAAWVVHPLALWAGAERDAEHIAWARGLASAARPYANGGVYLNFTGDEGPSRIEAAFGAPNLRRLVDVKRRYDPYNLFRLNHNIAPDQPVSIAA